MTFQVFEQVGGWAKFNHCFNIKVREQLFITHSNNLVQHFSYNYVPSMLVIAGHKKRQHMQKNEGGVGGLGCSQERLAAPAHPRPRARWGQWYTCSYPAFLASTWITLCCTKKWANASLCNICQKPITFLFYAKQYLNLGQCEKCKACYNLK